MTFNLGLRYELVLPYVAANGQMANLDAAPGFTAVSVVCPVTTPGCSGNVGPFSGQFPAGLINADKNNIGPRIGVAYRVRPSTIVRAGYSITYNPGSYATIARQLAAQPPLSVTETVLGSATPLPFQHGALATDVERDHEQLRSG